MHLIEMLKEIYSENFHKKSTENHSKKSIDFFFIYLLNRIIYNVG